MNDREQKSGLDLPIQDKNKFAKTYSWFLTRKSISAIFEYTSFFIYFFP